MVFIVKSKYFFRGNILCFFCEVEFGSMEFDFEHLLGNFRHLRVAFGSMGVNS